MGSMLRRCHNWDYRQRGIYMITLTVPDHRPLLGRWSGGETDATILLTPVGEMVAACWREIPGRYPGVTLMEYQVMPDHFHGIVFVREPQRKPLGSIIGACKSHSSSLFKMAAQAPPHAARDMPRNAEGAAAPSPVPPSAAFPVLCPAACGSGAGPPQPPSPVPPCAAGSVLSPAACGSGAVPPQPPSPVPPSAAFPILCPAACGSGVGTPQPPALWSPGFQDTILFHKGQLANMRGYILDNPRRLAVKRAHPELFRVVRDMPCCGTRFSAIGNHFLLDRPVKQQVQCSRSISPADLADQETELLAAARHGAVLVSPCISPGEKRIARAALEAQLPLIVLLENGFAPLYKPPGVYFEACAAGHLLMLAPWPYHSDKRTITRNQCLTLNAYAKECSK